MKLIDGLLVNGTAQTVGWLASIIRYLQTGLLYHYVFIMIIGLALLLGVFVFLAFNTSRKAAKAAKGKHQISTNSLDTFAP
jgi:ABC-type nickel/cobalt efflux system permease component RcnA